jgi:hypothetical protein
MAAQQISSMILASWIQKSCSYAHNIKNTCVAFCSAVSLDGDRGSPQSTASRVLVVGAQAPRPSRGPSSELRRPESVASESGR